MQLDKYPDIRKILEGALEGSETHSGLSQENNQLWSPLWRWKQRNMRLL